MKLKHLIFIIFIFLFSFCLANEKYRVLLNPHNPDIKTNINENILLILDYSNSMHEDFWGKTKYQVLLESLKIILSHISPNQNIGLRIYGYKWGFTPYDACKATKLFVPVENNNVENILSTTSSLSPKGMTPITYSLKLAVQKDFKNITGDKHIILITDGGENCDESPCTYAMSLVKYRKDIKIDVIALNIDNENDLAQLECTAKVTRGEIFHANTPQELNKSLNSAFSSSKSVDAKLFLH